MFLALAIVIYLLIGALLYVYPLEHIGVKLSRIQSLIFGPAILIGTGWIMLLLGAFLMLIGALFAAPFILAMLELIQRLS